MELRQARKASTITTRWDVLKKDELSNAHLVIHITTGDNKTKNRFSNKQF